MTLARRVFSIAGIYGIIVLLPLFAGASQFSLRNPPELTHPVFYWGFAGCAMAWQFAFLVIARDPVRYRALMLPSVAEKLIFGIAAVGLYLAGETSVTFLGGAIVDLVLGAFFLLSWIKTPRE